MLFELSNMSSNVRHLRILIGSERKRCFFRSISMNYSFSHIFSTYFLHSVYQRCYWVEFSSLFIIKDSSIEEIHPYHNKLTKSKVYTMNNMHIISRTELFLQFSYPLSVAVDLLKKSFSENWFWIVVRKNVLLSIHHMQNW